MNTFGRKFRVTIFGESHGKAVGAVLDGVPAGLHIVEGDFTEDLERRRPGNYPGSSSRRELDMPQIVSGLYEGYATGAPMALVFENKDMRSSDYDTTRTHPRPSHADWVTMWKYGGFADHRGSGHFSGRMTLPLVAAGVVAKRILGARVTSHIVEIGGQTDPARFGDVITAAMQDGDSVGGVVECRVEGVPAGLGEPFFDSAESMISHMLFSVPAVKGVEFGAGFASARLRGSQNNDAIVSADGTTSSNNDGGIVGGITNNNPIVVRVAFKPTPSICKSQLTLNTMSGEMEELRIKGRHDTCIVMRAAVVVEAAVAIALADLKLTGK